MVSVCQVKSTVGQEVPEGKRDKSLLLNAYFPVPDVGPTTVPGEDGMTAATLQMVNKI